MQSSSTKSGGITYATTSLKKQPSEKRLRSWKDMKIMNGTRSSPLEDLPQRTYEAALGSQKAAVEILDLIQSPADGEEEDPIMAITTTLVEIQAQLARIEQRLGIDSQQLN